MFTADATTLSREELIAAYNASRELTKEFTIVAKRASEFETKSAALATTNLELERQLAWFHKQYFGKKAEQLIKRDGGDTRQLNLGYEPEETPPPPTVTVKEYERKCRKEPVKFVEDESRLKFESTVPVQVVSVPAPETEGLSPDEYEVIGENVTHRLAQRPGAYVVLKFVRPVVKLKGKVVEAKTPPAVIERSVADVSFIAGLLLDKFLYHLPLYRQHQRLLASGVHLNRLTLTNLVHRAAELLEPIYRSVQSSVLISHVLAMDETHVKAGRTERGVMHQGWLWALYGDKDEVAFLYSSSRSGQLVKSVLSSFKGTLLSDGYKVYETFAKQREEVIHAQCWVHTRRKFFEAQESEPELSAAPLSYIGKLYEIEATYSRHERASHALPVVNEFFAWLKETFQRRALLPSSPFTKAASYALQREAALRVFLTDEKVPLDTNHLERQLRANAVGRKNWLFHWTEVGAEHAATIQSLIACCKLQGVDPYTYFVDVLQRIDSHPMLDIEQLTPRVWKQRFATASLKSALL